MDSYVNLLENALALLSWVQVRLLKLVDHKKAELIGKLIAKLEEFLKQADDMELIHRGEKIHALMAILQEITKEGAIIENQHMESLKDVIQELTRGPLYKRRTLIRESEIKERVKELARLLRDEINPSKTLVLGVLRGSIFFMVDLLRELNMPLRFDLIEAKSYGDKMHSSGEVKLHRVEELDLKDKIVLLVEDIVDTGHTLKAIVEFVKTQKPERLITCVLINKLERREVDVQIDYFGFRIEEGFLVGYGLDYADRYRCLPDICVLEPV